MIVYLVGNRVDLEDEREVATQDGIELMKELELDHHMETSALTGHNIGTLFETLTKHLYLENNGKLNEVREHLDTYVQRRSSSVNIKKQRNVDLYKPNPQKGKKKNGCCK